MLIATGRPQLDIAQRDTVTGKVADTIRVVAEHIMSVAESGMYAGGDVHMTRPELLATGDSTFMEQRNWSGTSPRQTDGRGSSDTTVHLNGRRHRRFLH